MSRPAGTNALLDPSWRPQVAPMAEGLSKWIAQFAPELGTLQSARFPDEGGSSFNLLFETESDVGRTSYVAKLGALAPHLVTFPDENLARQHRIIDLLRRKAGVLAPEIMYREDHPEWLGAPFFIMPRYKGQPWPSDPPYNFAGWVMESTAQERRRMQDAFVEVAAGIHSVDESNADLKFLDRPELGATALSAQVTYLEHYYQWGRRGSQFPLIEGAFAWLRSNMPNRTEPACITWGDARAGNLLFDQGRVTTVLDWEGAALGYPEIDLAFAEVMHRYYQLRAETQGHSGLPGLFAEADTAAEYTRLTGRPLEPLGWYRVLGATRAAVVQVRFICRPTPGAPGPTDIGDHRLTIGSLLAQFLSD